MRKFVIFIALALMLALTATTVSAAPPPGGPPGLERAIAAQEKHNAGLLSTPGVEGTAVGLSASGDYVIKIFVDRAGRASLPGRLDDVPVEVEVTGKFTAIAPPEGKGKNGGQPATTARWPRPVPIGISTGNEGECSAGTIGSRVKDSSGNVFALSNNHVYALENAAPIGSVVLQPGRYDTSCLIIPDNSLGNLSNFVPIVFDGTTVNTVDAALASTTTGNLGNATPSNGYGTPLTATVAPSLTTSVQKYGRTTKLTKGSIAYINWSGYIGYGSSGTAYFEKQFVVYSGKPFVKAGDSGSLIVTSGRNPVGLLFAGDSSGRYGIANDINEVLAKLGGVVIDGN